MNSTYQSYLDSDGEMEDVESFKSYLLTRDTLIIPDEGETVCAPWVSKKLHRDVEEIENKYFIKEGDIIYFVYSKYFDHIGEVKVLFDTTPYLTSQMIIIKTGLIFILLVSLLQFIAGKYISRRLLRDLISISKKVKTVDINSNNKHIICKMPKDDEIRVLAEALNASYDMIDEQTGKLKQFLTDVSHEFKTPLMGMQSELDVLEKKSQKRWLQTEDIKEFSSHIKNNIWKLNGLLETLFFLSRLEDGSTCLVKTNIHIEGFIEKKIEHFKKVFSHKNIQVKYNIKKDILYKVEENTFSILLDNIISNAIKFSPDDVHLEITATKNTLTIKDSGPGIEKKDLKKIWEKFYRKDTNKEWFGIGLYIVKRIIWIYGWDIHIDSKKWKWTSFKIDLR